MKSEKKASVLSTTKYSSEELTLYDASIINSQKQLCSNKSASYIESLSYELRTSSLTPENDVPNYQSTSENFQSLSYDCTYSKGTAGIQAVANIILKSESPLIVTWTE